MDIWLVIAGALFVIWPLQYRLSIRRIHRRVAARGGDTDRFDQAMNRTWIRVALVVAPVAGIVLIVLGIKG